MAWLCTLPAPLFYTLLPNSYWCPESQGHVLRIIFLWLSCMLTFLKADIDQIRLWICFKTDLVLLTKVLFFFDLRRINYFYLILVVNNFLLPYPRIWHIPVYKKHAFEWKHIIRWHICVVLLYRKDFDNSFYIYLFKIIGMNCLGLSFKSFI